MKITRHKAVDRRGCRRQYEQNNTRNWTPDL
jgi:hypothetical protein